MKLDELPNEIISSEIIKYLKIKDIINFQSSSKKINNMIKDDNNVFKTINISKHETKDVLEKLNKMHKVDMSKNTYIICLLNEQLFYTYIPDNLKKKFIHSKLLIMNGV